MSRRFVLLTGCSGGGKSTLLRALEKRGFATVPEPSRRIVAGELTRCGKALPWVNMKAFARRAVEMAQRDLEAAQGMNGIVFFDRSLIDAEVALLTILLAWILLKERMSKLQWSGCVPAFCGMG